MKKEVSCGGIIIHDNKILIVKQRNECYSFPKGHKEKGETDLETAYREIKEETNLEVSLLDEKVFKENYIIDKKIDKEVIYYIFKQLTTDIIVQPSEILEYKYVTLDELIKYYNFDSFKPLYPKIKKYLLENKYIIK